MTDCYSPPAQGTWWVLSDVVDSVLSRLRLRGTDIDRARIEQLVPVAAEQINNRLDRQYPLTPPGTVDDEDVLLETNATPGLIDALRDVTIELYLRRGNLARDAVTLVDVSDAVDVAAPDLEYAYKSRWGFA